MKIRIKCIGKYPPIDPKTSKPMEAEIVATDSIYWRRRKKDGDVEFLPFKKSIKKRELTVVPTDSRDK